MHLSKPMTDKCEGGVWQRAPFIRSEVSRVEKTTRSTSSEDGKPGLERNVPLRAEAVGKSLSATWLPAPKSQVA